MLSRFQHHRSSSIFTVLPSQVWLGEVASVTYINTFVRWSAGSGPAPSPVPCVMHCWRQLHNSASIVTCREARGVRPLRLLIHIVRWRRKCMLVLRAPAQVEAIADARVALGLTMHLAFIGFHVWVLIVCLTGLRFAAWQGCVFIRVRRRWLTTTEASLYHRRLGRVPEALGRRP